MSLSMSRRRKLKLSYTTRGLASIHIAVYRASMLSSSRTMITHFMLERTVGMRTLIVTTLSFAAGGACGYFLARHMLQKKYAKKATEEIADYKRTLAEMNEEELDSHRIRLSRVMLKELRKADAGVPEEFTTESGELKEEFSDMSTGPVVSTSIDYAALGRRNEGKKPPKKATAAYQNLVEKGIIDEAPILTEEEERTELVGAELPYVIHHQQFIDECDHFDKVTMFYYAHDDTVCGEDEVINDDIDGTIGWGVLKELDTQTTAWSRNEMRSEDYEIIRVDGSYAELVMGIHENMGSIERSENLQEFVNKRRKAGLS